MSNERLPMEVPRIPRRRWGPSRCLLVLLVGGFLLPPAMGREPRPPAREEAKRFQAIVQRLKANQKAMPTPVDEILRSFHRPARKVIDCPADARAEEAIWRVRTRQIHFDRALTVDGESRKLRPGRSAYYVWNATITIRGRREIIRANNLLMISPAIMKQLGEDTLGQRALEGLVYHELLHGQLVLDATSDPDWVRSLCNGRFRLLEATDRDHEVIPENVGGYWANRTADDTHLAVMPPPTAEVDDRGRFRTKVDLSGLEKDPANLRVDQYFPEGHNIVQGSLRTRITDDALVIRGRVRDAKRPSQMLLRIDPPAAGYYLGLERGLFIRPK